MSSSPEPIVRIERLTVDYRRPGAALRVLDGIDLEVRRGEIFGVIGQSGCGKTTLLSAILGLVTPSAGSIEVRAKSVAMVFQKPQLLPWRNVLDNAAYGLEDVGVFRALDAFDLLMVEQPLHHEDLIEHARLQRAIRTDLCLDESVRSAADARAALELGACRIVNIKQGRVGGVLEAKRVHDVCLERDAPVWCGGMLETGVGRATNLALAALPGFTLPGDTSASRRYFAEDLTEPHELAPDGTMAVPSGPGIGVEPDPERLDAATRRRERLRAT